MKKLLKKILRIFVMLEVTVVNFFSKVLATSFDGINSAVVTSGAMDTSYGASISVYRILGAIITLGQVIILPFVFLLGLIIYWFRSKVEKKKKVIMSFTVIIVMLIIISVLEFIKRFWLVIRSIN